MHHGVRTLKLDASGELRPDGWAAHRSGWVLTGKTAAGGAYAETDAGAWIPASALRVARLGRDFWGHAARGRKWIDISIELQTLVAYEGERPVSATLVSTGRGELGDPATTSATVQGTFFIREKHVTATMDGDELSESSVDLRDVPYVQYFHNSYALHGVYWHDAFGKVRSSGCVNLAPADAAWLFAWTDPPSPRAGTPRSTTRAGRSCTSTPDRARSSAATCNTAGPRASAMHATRDDAVGDPTSCAELWSGRAQMRHEAAAGRGRPRPRT